MRRISWRRDDAYGRTASIGASATVRVGYEYADCESVVWVDRQIPLNGVAPEDDKVINDLLLYGQSF